MSAARSAVDLPLLALCATLRRFDRELLVALGAHGGDELAALLASNLVVPVADASGAYQLDEAARATIVARLAAERPADELALHARAFAYFLRGMARKDFSGARIDAEARCLYHLGELRELLTERRDWRTIADYVAAVRAAGPRHARHLRQLALYEGFLAVRTGDQDRGEAVLTALLADEALEADTRVRALHALGQLHFLHARYDRALLHWRHAHALATATADRAYACRTLLNIGQAHSETGNHALALALSLQSLELARGLQAPAREAHALWEVGYAAMHLGRWAVARDHIAGAIRLYDALGVVARLANLYWCQGVLHHLLGDDNESEAAYRRALAIVESPEHHDPPMVMDTLWYLGFLHQTRGRWGEALASYDRAAAVARRLGNRQSLAFIDYRRGDVFRRCGRPDEALAAYRQAIDAVETLRGDTEDEAVKLGLLGTTQQIYEAAVLLCLERGRDAEAFDYVERARSRAFLDLLAQQSPELYAAADQPVATLAEVQARLPGDTLLIEYFTTGVLPHGEHLLNKVPAANAQLRDHLLLPPRTLIFAVTRDGCAVHRAALNPNTLRPPAGTPHPGRRLLTPHHQRLLYRHLIAPVEGRLRGRALLYLIPHGPLHYAPFMALRAEDGAHLLRADGPAVALAPSATILLRQCLGRPASGAAGFLALGYDDRGPAALRYAEAEARHLARLAGGEAWTGPGPKARRLLAAGHRARWLHFAGHAVFDPDDPLASALRLGDGDALTARAIMDGPDLGAELVTLSACTTGVSQVLPGDELLGLPRAFLHAGARTVVCTLWEASDLVAWLVMERFYRGLQAGRAPAEALRDAQVAVREMRGREVAAALDRWGADDHGAVRAPGGRAAIPADDDDACVFADPFYWAPFMLIGRPRAERE